MLWILILIFHSTFVQSKEASLHQKNQPNVLGSLLKVIYFHQPLNHNEIVIQNKFLSVPNYVIFISKSFSIIKWFLLSVFNILLIIFFLISDLSDFGTLHSMSHNSFDNILKVSATWKFSKIDLSLYLRANFDRAFYSNIFVVPVCPTSWHKPDKTNANFSKSEK